MPTYAFGFVSKKVTRRVCWELEPRRQHALPPFTVRLVVEAAVWEVPPRGVGLRSVDRRLPEDALLKACVCEELLLPCHGPIGDDAELHLHGAAVVGCKSHVDWEGGPPQVGGAKGAVSSPEKVVPPEWGVGADEVLGGASGGVPTDGAASAVASGPFKLAAARHGAHRAQVVAERAIVDVCPVVIHERH